MGIILALLVFSFIVFFHELGHFLLAKKNGIRVDEFAIGMGPKLIGKTWGETEYCIRILPIGGACMMGEDEDDISEGSFNSKSVGARASVIAAGAVFNFILALVFSIILVAWIGYSRPVIGSVAENSSAAQAGIQAGDEIVKINGKRILTFQEISTYNQLHQGETQQLVIKRDGEKFQVKVEPRKNANGLYMIGITESGRERANLFTAVKYGACEVRYWIDTTIASLKMLFTGKVGFDQLSGPVGIVNLVDEAYKASRPSGVGLIVLNLLNISILLSANLGVMNLLPLPALDGGRLVFLILEGIRGKRIPPEKEGMVHLAGIIVLFGLMVFVMFNDIKNIFF